MTTTYIAHIIIDVEQNYGEITITTRSIDGEQADEIATYPLIDLSEVNQTLNDGGWKVIGNDSSIEAEYPILAVEPENIESIIRHVAIAKDHAEMVYQNKSKAWETLVQNAIKDGISAEEIASIAMVSSDELY